jgi:hypothetical protein
MPLTPIAGVERLRAFQLGLESTFKTQVAATRRMPWTFVPTINPNWTTPTNDTGTLDPAQPPYGMALDITGTATGQLASNDVPTLQSAGIMGGVSLVGGGAAKTFTTAPASTTQDVFDTYTGEVYDDATADAWVFMGGYIEQFTLDYPQDQGPIVASSNWRFSKVASTSPGSSVTAGLSVDASPAYLYCADTQLYINDTSGAIGTTQLVDQFYGGSLTLNNNIDAKRFANGSNTRFQVQGLSRGPRQLDYQLTFAKVTAAIAEATKWIAASPTERFMELRTTSTVLITGSSYHQLAIRIPGYWFTRAEANVNTNTAFTMAGKQIYDTTLTYPLRVVSTSSRTAI